MYSFAPIAFSIAALVLPVAGHGWVGSITVAGKLYPGNGLGTTGGPSVIRQVDTNSPVISVSDPNLTCGPNAQLAQDVAAANPGDAIDVDWVSTEGPWFHNVGPMLTYLASCGSEPCSQFPGPQAMWFKIQQSGRDSSGKWVQAQLSACIYISYRGSGPICSADSGAPANLSLPSNLAAGNYLLRHEIIALQNAVSQGGAEFYASCSQLTVGGSGSGVPATGELVKLPGAYSATDPGILVDVYANPNAPYTFPGPPIAAFVSSGASGGASSGGVMVPPVSPSMSRPTATSTTAAAPSTPSASCRLRRNILPASLPSGSSPGTVKRLHRTLRNFPIFRK